MAERDKMVNQALELQREFSRLVRRIDQDELPLAVQSARKLVNDVDGLLAQVQEDLVTDFKTHRFRTLQDDLQSISKLEATPPKTEDLPELSTVAAHLSKQVRAIDSLVRLVYPPKPFSLEPYLKRYGKIAAVAFVSALIIIVGVARHRSYVTKREGLIGRYFGGTGFEAAERVQTDKTISFRYGRRGPFGNWRRDNFSIRWTGYVYVPYAETWEFTTVSDDGVKLYIGGQLVVSNWTIHGVTENKAALKLKEGYYPVTLEYFQGRGNAAIQLLWRSGTDPRPDIIPASNLFTSARYLKSGIEVIETVPPEAVVSASVPPPVVAAPVPPPAPAPVAPEAKVVPKEKAAPPPPAVKNPAKK